MWFILVCVKSTIRDSLKSSIYISFLKRCLAYYNLAKLCFNYAKVVWILKVQYYSHEFLRYVGCRHGARLWERSHLVSAQKSISAWGCVIFWLRLSGSLMGLASFLREMTHFPSRRQAMGNLHVEGQFRQHRGSFI